jgi:hypothetical protein
MVITCWFGIVSQGQSQCYLLGLPVQNLTYNNYRNFLLSLIYNTVSLKVVQRYWKIFIRWTRPALAAIILASAFSSCTMVSREMLPGMEYREHPRVVIIEYQDHARLQADCVKQHKKADWNYSGCSLVPHDPRETCLIRIMKGDEKTKKHELAHCHGHADTFWPWMADFDFYSTPEPGQ